MSKSSNQTLVARWKNVRCFAAVIRSPKAVRNAFQGQWLLAWWWRVVLALHGKPLRNDFTAQDQCVCVAAGFRFYGWLYRFLGVLFGVAMLFCLHGGLTDPYWITFLAFGGIYLWVAGGLAISGAKEYCDSRGSRTWLLVAFLFFIAIFLVVTLTIFSSQAKFAHWLPDTVNITTTLGILIFGVGSYLIELAALVANEHEANRLT